MPSNTLPRTGLVLVTLLTTSTSLWAFGEAKGIDGFRVIDPTHYQVFSQRGMGAFNLIAQQNTQHSVCFYYSDAKPFTQLEGVTIAMTTDNGDRKLMDYTVSKGCVEFEFRETENLPLQIEFVDVYR